MNKHTYTIQEPSVVAEIIDGEAIIMDMASGTYFSSDGVGAIVWQDIIDGRSHDQILSAAEAAYPQASQARREIEAYLDELMARSLVKLGPEAHATASATSSWGGDYQTPRLSSHEDMQDLIQLDPIHDVDQVGWPVRKSDA